MNHIEKLHRDFLLRGLGDDFKFHLVKWGKACSPIPFGGLGIRNLGFSIGPYLGKGFDDIYMEPGALWKSVIYFKYGGLWGVWSSGVTPRSRGVRKIYFFFNTQPVKISSLQKIHNFQ